jgi:hypothetical protein
MARRNRISGEQGCRFDWYRRKKRVGKRCAQQEKKKGGRVRCPGTYYGEKSVQWRSSCRIKNLQCAMNLPGFGQGSALAAPIVLI